MKIVVADDSGNEYDVEAPDGASIAYAVQKASKDLGFKVKHVEKEVPDDLAVTAAQLEHTVHQLRMESNARARAELAVDRQTRLREKAEDALESLKGEMEKLRAKEAQSERARSEAAGKVIGLERALATAESALMGMRGMMAEADKRHTTLLQAAQDSSKQALESEIKARGEAEARCTALIAEVKRPLPARTPVAPNGWVLDIEGVDTERPRRRAKISPAK